MKNILLIAFCLLVFQLDLSAQQYRVVTSVESIVPNGLGRSRIINALEEKDYREFTSVQTEDDNTRNKSDRSEIRVKNFEETKLLNFYNIGGIRFQNIAANDALITSMINDMTANGWELTFVSSAVESEGGKGDGQGIFITRYIFKK
jgi:predicted lactoylglutathione lyase